MRQSHKISKVQADGVTSWGPIERSERQIKIINNMNKGSTLKPRSNLYKRGRRTEKYSTGQD